MSSGGWDEVVPGTYMEVSFSNISSHQQLNHAVLQGHTNHLLLRKMENLCIAVYTYRQVVVHHLYTIEVNGGTRCPCVNTLLGLRGITHSEKFHGFH